MRSLLVVLWLVACSRPSPIANRPAPTSPVATAVEPAPTVEEYELDTGAVTLHVRRVRAATTPTTTLIALHGGPGLSHEYMRPFESLASPTTQVAMFDQRGTGRSTRPTRGGLAFDDHAEDIEHLRVHLGAAKLDLVGHSYGGGIAMAYAIRYPAKVRSLILVDTMPPKYGDYMAGQWYFSEAMVEHASAGHIPRPLPAVEGDDCSKRLIALLPIYFHDKQHPMTKHLAGSTCHEAIGDETRAANEHYDLHDELEHLEIPTLIVHGVADPFRRQMADATAAALARSKPRLEILEACGHVPFEECPEKLWPIVREFLAARP